MIDVSKWIFLETDLLKDAAYVLAKKFLHRKKNFK